MKQVSRPNAHDGLSVDNSTSETLGTKMLETWPTVQQQTSYPHQNKSTMTKYWKFKPNSLSQEDDQNQVFSVQCDYLLVFTHGMYHIYHVPLLSSRNSWHPDFSHTAVQRDLMVLRQQAKKLDAATIPSNTS